MPGGQNGPAQQKLPAQRPHRGRQIEGRLAGHGRFAVAGQQQFLGVDVAQRLQPRQ